MLTLVLSLAYLAYIGTWWWILRPAGDIRSFADVLDFVLVFSLFPLLITLVLFFTPDRFDPLIPWRSKILLGGERLDPHSTGGSAAGHRTDKGLHRLPYRRNYQYKMRHGRSLG